MRRSTHVADHRHVTGLRHDRFDEAGSLRADEGRHTVAQHLRDDQGSSDTVPFGVVPARHQLDVLQDLRVVVHLLQGHRERPGHGQPLSVLQSALHTTTEDGDVSYDQVALT